MRHRFALILLSVLLALGLAAGLPGGALADGREGDNSAVAINTKDDASRFRLAFKVSRVAGDVVDNVNLAIAFSQCERCRTTAIAVQIVLVDGSPSTITPQNIAVAVNEQCTLCQSFASARQFVIGRGEPLKFTALGRQQLAEIRHDLHALREETLSPPELDQRVSAIVDRLRVVLDTQLVPAAPDEDDESDEDIDVDEEDTEKIAG